MPGQGKKRTHNLTLKYKSKIMLSNYDKNLYYIYVEMKNLANI